MPVLVKASRRAKAHVRKVPNRVKALNAKSKIYLQMSKMRLAGKKGTSKYKVLAKRYTDLKQRIW